MKLHNRYPSAGAAAVLIAALVASFPVAAQGKDELWEISSKMEMAGMPMAMPAPANRVCVGKNRKFTYKMECAGNEPMTILGELTFGTNAYDGQMRMTMTKTKDTMNMAVSGKRVGDCTAPAK